MILDCSTGRKKVQLWTKDSGSRKVRRTEFDYQPFFYLHLPDPHRFGDMLDELETTHVVEECEFTTIYRELDGYRIYCGADEMRELAEKIESHTSFEARLYNVDVRLDQRFFAENGLIPGKQTSRFDAHPGFENVEIAEVEVKGEKNYPSKKNRVAEIILNGFKLEGDEKTVLQDFSRQLEFNDPDIILFPHADYWMDLMLNKCRHYGISLSLSMSRSDHGDEFKRLTSKSYFSYGRVYYRPSAYLPQGRILIDTINSFNYREGGLDGVLLAARLACISPNYAARFTPGTLISSYEVYEALERGIAIPFRKREAEKTRTLEDLKLADRGGMIFQPEPEIHEDVHQLDFTSMYPAIIVEHNLSSDKENFLPRVLEPLLNLRIDTKRRKKTDPSYKGIDSILKWMLVTCFGYTGYKNAKFGRIEVHESITRIGREILLKTKELADKRDLEILHGIVDCLWVKGDEIEVKSFKQEVERETGLLTDLDHYNWISFLPMADETGAYNRYYGRLDTGELKHRGVAARRSDVPQFVKDMQLEIFEELSRAESLEGILRAKDTVWRVYKSYRDELKGMKVDPEQLTLHRRLSRLDYSRKCPQISAIKAYREAGIYVAPGVDISFVVIDAARWMVSLPWRASTYDRDHYLSMLDKAWEEISYTLNRALEKA
ncbi:MAG: type B DNA-directed DNA polymerase [Archaeoglobaceae archaeon]